MRYFVKIGNTHVAIEVRPHDGICEHCGKTHIKYLAHVRQDIADTFLRASGKETKHGGAIEPLAPEDKLHTVAAMSTGKRYKEAKVGCVCVWKYLEDCGVDKGVAQRLQSAANRVVSQLVKLGKLTEARTSEEHMAEAQKRYDFVVTLRTRYYEYARECGQANVAGMPVEDYRSYAAMRSTAHREFTAAAERFRKEHFGWPYSFGAAGMSRADYEMAIDRQIGITKRKLGVYERPTFVADEAV